MSDPEADAKRLAGEHAAGLVQSGMLIGLGTGSTAIFFTRRVAARIAAGELPGVEGYATSRAVWLEAERLGIPMTDEALPRGIDLTVDGADEIDPDLNLIKGGGGALLREKIVAQASARMIVVADVTKLSARLGTLHALPVEVLEFGWQSQARFLAGLNADVTLRRDGAGQLARSDQGNLLLDCRFDPIGDARVLAEKLEARAGIVGHGLFLGIASEAVIAGPDGIRHMKPQASEISAAR